MKRGSSCATTTAPTAATSRGRPPWPTRRNNIHVGGGKSKEDFVKFRTERDAQLDMPKLIIPSLQVNMRAGDVPTDKDGNPMLKVPINAL
jgi:hypothetical protein